MPEYLSPGVYVEEIDAGPKPIAGVGTSTTGAVGLTVRGPTSEKPQLVTSFADFQRTFGGFIPDPEASLVNKWTLDGAEGGRWWTFPLAVKGFFDNGGQRLYVKRVISSTATAATADLGRGLVSELTRDAALGSDRITLRHLFGLSDVAPNNTLRLFTADGEPILNGTGGTDFTVTAYDSGSNQVTLSEVLPTALSAGGDFAEFAARTGTGNPADITLSFSAKALGAWGQDLSVRVRPVLANTLTVLPNPTSGPALTAALAADAAPGTTLVVDADPGFDDATDGDFWIRVGGTEHHVTALVEDTPAAGQSTLTLDGGTPTATDLVTGTTVTRLRSAALAQPDQLNLGGASTRLYGGAVVELDSGRGKETLVVDQTAGDLVTFTSDVAGAYLENHKARVIEAEVSVRYEPDIGDPTDETFGPLRLVEDDSASSLVNNVNARSNLVTVATGAGYSDSIVAFPTAAGGGWANAAGGDDGNAGLSVDDFMGIDPVTGDRQGIDALELIDEVAICVTPGMWSQTVRNALTQHCELLQDRFAIVDPRDALDIEGVREFRSPIDTRYAALYYPWLRVRDPAAGREVTAPPSGHMAGIYARVDVERGVHKAPANVVVRGINGFEKDVTKREQDLLNPQGINAFRFFPGRGNRVWGARTLTSDSAWKYVNVRRLFIFVEESIDEGTQWVVFEPNAEPLWARVRASVTNFLTTVWRSGALEGTTAEQAFFVVCDRTTMTQDDIDNGRLICLVGIAPVKPAEFVIFRIQQKTLEVVA